METAPTEVLEEMDGLKRQRTAESVESSRIMQSNDTTLITFKSRTPVNLMYVRTRHNNLRCFPSCAPTHKPSRFCGSQIYINVKRTELNIGKENKIFGGFHKAGISAEGNWKLDQPFNEEAISSDIGYQLLQARKYREDEEFLYFIFMPDNKWTYAATLDVFDLHYFTIFLVVDDIVNAVKHSEAFRVIPAWKLESSKDGSRISRRKSRFFGTLVDAHEETTPSASNNEQDMSASGDPSITPDGIASPDIEESQFRGVQRARKA